MKDGRHENRLNREREDRDERDIDRDQLRDDTMNETIRNVSGSPDTNLNEVKKEGRESDDIVDSSSTSVTNTDQTQGADYNPNDASGVRGGGVADMDQTSSGVGLNTGVRRRVGSHLNTKTGMSGSDFDGQNVTP